MSARYLGRDALVAAALLLSCVPGPDGERHAALGGATATANGGSASTGSGGNAGDLGMGATSQGGTSKSLAGSAGQSAVPEGGAESDPIRETGGRDAGGTGTGGLAGGGTGGGGCAGPVGRLAGELSTGIALLDTDGKRVNAHGGGIIRVSDKFYLHGEYFVSGSKTNDFAGFAMYSSSDFSTWKNEGIILPTQASGELGPTRKGERPHIIQCPASGEFVLYAHAASADYQTDKEVVFATSATVNGQYAYRGPLLDAQGKKIVHSDMSAYADDTGAYVITEAGHVFTLAENCHSWLNDHSYPTVNGDSGGIEAPTIFRSGATYYWLGSYKTGWRANNNFYSTAPAMTGPWTYQGYFAPVKDPSNNISDERTWLSQVTWVQPVVGCKSTTYVYIGDHWDGTESTAAPGRNNDLATYVVQPLIFDGQKISLPVYRARWELDLGAGTWSQ